MPSAIPTSKAVDRHSPTDTSTSEPSPNHDTFSTSPSSPSSSSSSSASASSSPSPPSQLRNLVSGGVGGICAVLVGHPFDLVKVRMQTAERGTYKSAADVVRKTVAREGMARGLYAGVSAPLVGVTPMFMVSFWGYGVGKSIVEQWSASSSSSSSGARGSQNGGLTIPQLATAGFLSAIPMTLITAPFERVKVLLQLQGQKQLAPGEKPRYSGGLDVVRQLYRDGGVRSVFRGSAMTLARDGPGSAAYFATYEFVKRKLTPASTDGEGKGKAELSLSAVLTAGGLAGIAMWIPVFPVDTVKSRLQSADLVASSPLTTSKSEPLPSSPSPSSSSSSPSSPSSTTSKPISTPKKPSLAAAAASSSSSSSSSPNPTILSTIRDLYRSGGGIRAFFPGFGPALARAVPANAATFLGVEMALVGMRRFLGE